MKKIVLFFLFTALCMAAFGQYNRRVLCEAYSNASCPPCASQNPAYTATIKANAEFVTPIKYQVWWPGFDPMHLHNVSDVQNRVNYYGITGVPAGRQNGVTTFSVGSYSATMIQNAWNNLTPVQMWLEHTVSDDISSVHVKVTLLSDQDILKPLRLRTAILEDEINFQTAPGTNGEKDFHKVMKKMLPSAEGLELPDGLVAGDTLVFEFEWTPNLFYNLNRIAVASWIQDDATKEVWQSAYAEPNTDLVGGNYVRLMITNANNYRLLCNDNVAPAMLIRNAGTAALNEINFLYSTDNENWLEHQWTGNLNANLTTSILFPTITFDSNYVNNRFWIRVKDTNLGRQLNQVDGSGSIAYDVFKDESAEAPIIQDFEIGSFPPAGYGKRDDATGSAWQLTNAAGGFGLSSSSMFADFYNYTAGKTFDLVLPKFKLEDGYDAQLSFEYAHAQYSAQYSDRLIVEISTNCGSSWTPLFDKLGAALTTAPATTSAFVPSATQWLLSEHSLNDYVGQEGLLIRFRALSGYSNRLYVDNIALTTSVSAKNLPEAFTSLMVAPNPSAGASELRFSLDRAQDLNMLIFGADGRLVEMRGLGLLNEGAHVIHLDGARLPAGSYRVSLQGSEGIAQIQWIKF
ncbi:MAG: choice-of-anchor J domain-containing protein [Saprospiraceae bacterium]